MSSRHEKASASCLKGSKLIRVLIRCTFVRRAERIRLVNYCVLEESLKQLSSCDGSRALAEYVQVAGEKCEDSCNVYVSKIAEKEFGGLLEVACHLKLTIDHGVQAAELPYHPGCEEEAVRKGLLSVNTRSFQVSARLASLSICYLLSPNTPPPLRQSSISSPFDNRLFINECESISVLFHKL